MNYLSLFSGIGGMDLGLDRAGWLCVGQVEIDPWCRRVLARHWPDVPRHDDVVTAVDWWRVGFRPRVDAIVGGYPCQPESVAGKRRGVDDPRWLWPYMREVVDAVRPAVVIGENVPGHRIRGLGNVLRDLRELGYSARAGVVRACEMGAPHARARLFVVAYANGIAGASRVGPGSGGTALGRDGGSHSRHWPVAPESGVRRVVDGAPRGVDRRRLKAIGNAVVPQVAEFVGRLVTRELAEYAAQGVESGA